MYIHVYTCIHVYIGLRPATRVTRHSQPPGFFGRVLESLFGGLSSHKGGGGGRGPGARGGGLGGGVNAANHLGGVTVGEGIVRGGGGSHGKKCKPDMVLMEQLCGLGACVGVTKKERRKV